MSGSSSTSRVAVIDRLHAALESLGLTALPDLVEARLEHASRTDQAYGEFLLELLECEVTARRDRYLRTRMRLAHLPAVKTFEQFASRAWTSGRSGSCRPCGSSPRPAT